MSINPRRVAWAGFIQQGVLMFGLILVAINIATIVVGALGEREPGSDHSDSTPCS